MDLAQATPASLRAVGVDWGTTHRRGYALAADGHCLAEASDGQGMLAARGRFDAALDDLLSVLGVPQTRAPILMSGMVGSATGWIDAGYLDAPLPLTRLRERLVWIAGARHRVAVVPGVVLRRGAQVDVMRGEETQLLGATALGHHDGWFVLPGTHGKWVRLDRGAIVDFATYLTGELFALLGSQGTLAAVMSGGDDGPHHAAAFADGLAASGSGAVLSHELFVVRARVVAGAMPADQARSYLSGLLVGAEWHDVKRRCGGRLPGRVTAIASEALTARHAYAARWFGVTLHTLDPRAAYVAALAQLVD